jgi:outer membrane protein assembly factor BamB
MNHRWLLLATLCWLAGGTAARADDWPQFRGPDRTNVSREMGLLQEWPKEGPKLLWKINTAGIGYSGVSVVGDVLYTMGARKDDTGKESEFALALRVKDGSELWAVKLGPIFTFELNTWGDGPRGTPTVDGDFVYCLAGFGELVCLKRDKGDVVWRKNLLKDFKGQPMVYSEALTGKTGYGYCESPLIDGDRLICCPGGANGWMLALAKKTGKPLWSTRELTEEATDSSVVVATIGGVRQYINSTFKGNNEGGGVAGVHAETGKVLWYFHVPKWNKAYAVCATPVVRDDLVYVSAGYGGGCNLIQVTKKGDKFTAEDVYDKKAGKLMHNEHGGVLLLGDYVYGYSDTAGWLCQEFKTGKEAWSERNKLDGKASLTYADGRLYLLSEEGEVCLIEANPKEWVEKGRFELPAKSPTHTDRPTHGRTGVWTHPVVANGQLYLRDQELLFCYSVKK